MIMQLNPYLIFNDQCEEAFKFYAQCLGGKIEALLRGKDTPIAGQLPPDRQDKIMHACLVVDGKQLMGSDSPAEHYHAPQGSSVTVTVEDPDEATRIFKALATSGKIDMDLAETFWAIRFGMVTDRFGVRWMVNCEKKTA
jgi:PhnB protein